MSNDITVTPVETGTIKTGEAVLQAAGSPPGAATVQDAASTEVAPTVPELATKTEDAAFAQKFAALSRKEKALKAKESQYEARIKEYEARLANMETEYKTKYIDSDSLSKNPLKVLQDKGFSPEQLAELILNDGKKTPESLIAAAQKAMEEKYSSLEKQIKDREDAEKKREQESAVHGYKSEISDFVKKEGSAYELISAEADGIDLVYDTIEEYYTQTQQAAIEAGEENAKGKILTHKEACDLVEKYLEDEAKAYFSKAKTKLTNLTGLTAKPAQTEVTKPVGQESKTLSNEMSTSSRVVDHSKLSDDDSKREAAKLIRWDA